MRASASASGPQPGAADDVKLGVGEAGARQRFDDRGRGPIVLARLDRAERQDLERIGMIALCGLRLGIEAEDVGGRRPVEGNRRIGRGVALELDARALGIDKEALESPHGEAERERQVELRLEVQVLAPRQEEEVVHVEHHAPADEKKEGRRRKAGEHELGARMGKREQRQQELLLHHHGKHAVRADGDDFGVAEVRLLEQLDRQPLDAGHVAVEVREVEEDLAPAPFRSAAFCRSGARDYVADELLVDGDARREREVVGARATLTWLARVVERGADGARQRHRVADRRHMAVAAVIENLERAGGRRGSDRQAVGHRFDEHVAEALRARGGDEAAGALVGRPGLARITRKLDAAGEPEALDLGPEEGLVGSLAQDEEARGRPVEEGKGAEQRDVVLLGDEAAEGEHELLAGGELGARRHGGGLRKEDGIVDRDRPRLHGSPAADERVAKSVRDGDGALGKPAHEGERRSIRPRRASPTCAHRSRDSRARP